MGTKKLGIISLNSFAFTPLEVNRYDENGVLMEEKAGYMTMEGFQSQQNGFSAQFSQVPDRGYAEANLIFQEDDELDLDKAAGFLCADCLNKVMENRLTDEFYGVGVIDFSTRKLKLFEKSITAFQFGDWYIDCDLQEPQKKDDSIKMSLLLFYCPLRYSDPIA